MLPENQSRPEYDFPTAVTFLFAGLALGAILTVLFSAPTRGGRPFALRREP
jgi:hypothetical protein